MHPITDLEGTTVIKVIEIPAADALILILSNGLRVVVQDPNKSIYHA